MGFENKDIEFLIETLSNEVNAHEYFHPMLRELEVIAKHKDLYFYDMPSCLIFSCVEKGTLKSIGFKLFMSHQFGERDLLKWDWEQIEKSIHKDIRKNLPKKIQGLGHESLLESHQKDLSDLTEQLEKLQAEYKTYWRKNGEMESNISATQANIEAIKENIPKIEEKMIANKRLLEADQKIDVNQIIIKKFCQLMFGDLVNEYEEYPHTMNGTGEYSKQYIEILDSLQKEMFARLQRVVGYRFDKNIDKGDKHYPYIDVAVIKAFVGSLNVEESPSGKHYFIKCDDNQKIEIDTILTCVGGEFLFKDLVTLGIYEEILKADRLGLDNAKVISAVKANYDKNKSCVDSILKNIAKNFDANFFNPNGCCLLEGTLSNVDEIFRSEKETIELLSNGLRESGYIVSKEYIVEFVFEQRLQNFINARLEKIETCVSDYLDTGLAVPLINTLFPEEVLETQEDAEQFLEALLANPKNDRLRLALSREMAKQALVRAEERVKQLSPKASFIFDMPRECCLSKVINDVFYGEAFYIPEAVMKHVAERNKPALREKFIKKLKAIYRKEIAEYKQGLIQEVTDSLSTILDKSLNSVVEWQEKMQKAIVAIQPLDKKFRKLFSKMLYREIFPKLTDVFIKKFDIKRVFVAPEHPMNVEDIAGASNQAVSALLQGLGVHKNDPKYTRYYDGFIKSYNQVLFEWECDQIKKLLKQAVMELDAATNNLIAKGYFESRIDFISKSAKTTAKAAVAIGGSSLLLGMTPQAMLCLSLMQTMANANPIIGISVFILCYKYALPKVLDDKTKASLEKYEQAILTACNMAMLPITEFMRYVQSLLQLKFPKNREKLSKMLIAFVSALAGALAFIYCPAIVPVKWVAGAVNISPLIFAYAVASFTFLASALCLKVNYNSSFEEKIKNLLSESLNIENLKSLELEFLTLFQDLGKENDFLKTFEDFLDKIKNKPKNTQAKAIVNFLEARTLDLLSVLPLLSSDEKLCGINDIMNNLKKLSVTILANTADMLCHADAVPVEQAMCNIEALIVDVPRRYCKP